jgi:hypothetical protein
MKIDIYNTHEELRQKAKEIIVHEIVKKGTFCYVLPLGEA